MANTMLPPEYQEEIDAALRQQKLAALLMQRSLQAGDGPQMISGHYVGSSPLSHLARLLGQSKAERMDAEATSRISKARKRYEADADADLAKIRGLQYGSPEQQVENFVMAPDERGNIPTATQPGQAPDLMAAERAGASSGFPASQAVAKALFEQRMKALEKFRDKAADRAGLQDLPSIFAQQTPELPAGVRSKQKVQMVEGLPVAVPEEFSPGGPMPQLIGPGYQPTTVAGADGRPMAAQQNPLTKKTDVLDKAGRTSVQVNTQDTEDPYWKKVMTDLGEKDAARVTAGRDAPEQIAQVSRIRQLHFDSKGQWTGGPAAGPVRFIRDLASQAGIPIDASVDLTNSKLQAEFSSLIARAILGQGRGLTDSDRQALERSYPGFQVTPRQMPAFLAQYERILRDNAQFSNNALRSMQRGRGTQAPTALRDNPVLPAQQKPASEMSIEEIEAELRAVRRR